MAKVCPCGSGLERDELTDAAGIFCCFTCAKCEREKRAKFNPAIFAEGSAYSMSGEEEDIGIDRDAETGERIIRHLAGVLAEAQLNGHGASIEIEEGGASPACMVLTITAPHDQGRYAVMADCTCVRLED